MIDRVVDAVCEHVISEHTPASGNEGVGIDKAANSGGVITALQVIKLCFGIVDIAPVAEGIIRDRVVFHTAVGAQQVELFLKLLLVL